MTYKPWEPLQDATHQPRGSSEFVSTFADRMALREREREERHRLALAEQSAIDNTPGMRIRAWERVHDLRMPSDPEHPILTLIAEKTGLTRAQVREEQSARRAPAAS
jgi:hypothetical protein